MSMLGKSEEQITQEMASSARANGLQAIGIFILVMAVLAKGWTLHVEGQLEEATTRRIVSEQLFQSCLNQAPETNSKGCAEREQAVATALYDIAALSSSFPNQLLLPLLGTVKRDRPGNP